MATNQSYVCSYGIGQARYLAKMPGTNDAIVFVLLQTGHEDDKTLWGRETLAQVLAQTANKECTATGYTRVKITSGSSEAADTVNYRVDVDLPDTPIGEIGTIDGAGSKQDVRALLVCYQFDQSTANNSTTYVLSKHYYPMVCDGTPRTIPFPNGFYRGALPAALT